MQGKYTRRTPKWVPQPKQFLLFASLVFCVKNKAEEILCRTFGSFKTTPITTLPLSNTGKTDQSEMPPKLGAIPELK